MNLIPGTKLGISNGKNGEEELEMGGGDAQKDLFMRFWYWRRDQEGGFGKSGNSSQYGGLAVLGKGEIERSRGFSIVKISKVNQGRGRFRWVLIILEKILFLNQRVELYRVMD